MGASKAPTIPEEWRRPGGAALAVLLLLAAAAAAYWYWTQGGRPRHGTKYVLRSEGVVRRSTRSHKAPQRFEPVLHGPGGTPTKDATPKTTPKVLRTPKAAVAQAAAAVGRAAEETPVVVKRPVGRPRKTPLPANDAANAPASPPTSPMRTRRGQRTPK